MVYIVLSSPFSGSGISFLVVNVIWLVGLPWLNEANGRFAMTQCFCFIFSQYELSRMQTHTGKGIGLGFGSMHPQSS